MPSVTGSCRWRRRAPRDRHEQSSLRPRSKPARGHSRCCDKLETIPMTIYFLTCESQCTEWADMSVWNEASGRRRSSERRRLRRLPPPSAGRMVCPPHEHDVLVGERHGGCSTESSVTLHQSGLSPQSLHAALAAGWAAVCGLAWAAGGQRRPQHCGGGSTNHHEHRSGSRSFAPNSARAGALDRSPHARRPVMITSTFRALLPRTAD